MVSDMDESLSLEKQLSVCPRCKRKVVGVVKRRRLFSTYADDALNYMTCCEECYQDICDYWRELWRDYLDGLYSS